MARLNFVCLIRGHRWKRERMPNRTLRLTCKRCGDIDVVDKDFDIGQFGAGGGGAGVGS